MGTFSLREVPEKSGVAKMAGKETPWTKPAHLTLKYKINAATKDFFNGDEEEEETEE